MRVRGLPYVFLKTKGIPLTLTLTIKNINIMKSKLNPNIKTSTFAYISLAKLEVEDFISICDKLEEHGEKISKRKKQWISMIDAGKMKCAITGNSIAYLSYDITNHKKLELRTYHFNFYDINDQLITVDHILPKSLGGSVMEVGNLQPMIGEHNWKKGSNLNYSPKI